MNREHIRKILRSALALVLALCLCAAPVPLTGGSVASAHWADPAMAQLRDWGVMRGDQNGSMEPDRAITRAEFVSMINRAFGYKQTGKSPFKDISGSEWYANDIRIAYNQGYFVGSSRTTASPNDNLTREEAAALVCRNLMLTPDEGENLIFRDGRSISTWARGVVTAAAQKGLLRGDEDGSFRPQDAITRGEVASLLARTIGTPVNKAGRQSLGYVGGNVMISASGAELYNTTIDGDLYITAGVGLGYVNLDNVQVNGQIIAAGAGLSNGGGSSVTLRNCTASEMVIDSPNNVAISVRAEGNTRIEKAFVRTDAYLEDDCYGPYGFQYIEVDGEPDTRLDLDGDFQEIVLKCEGAQLGLGRGSIEKLTVDEAAEDAEVNIDVDAYINEVYLDAATTITGAGDIGYLKVNVEGCDVEMLPDRIEIRPGITATINGEEMTSKDAELMSRYPRILAGYPKVDDVGPNAANSVVNTNKTGNVHWGVTLAGDGAISIDELVQPPRYGAKAIVKGVSPIELAETDIQTAINSLKPNTEYMLSTVLVDERGDKSPRKTRTFKTPDNSIPAFAAGYPKLTDEGYKVDNPETGERDNYYAQFEVVVTKTSTVYYALYKRGLPAPTADELRTQTMSGYVKGAAGKFAVVKNEPQLFEIENLEEQTEYDLYLVASDGINTSPVKKFSFKTADKTPPEFIEPYPTFDNAKETSVDVLYEVNEKAKVYWVIVNRGDTYPVPPEDWEDGASVPFDSDEAKRQVMRGSNALNSGTANAVEGREGKFTISGLKGQTNYDVYLLLEDASGNLGKAIVHLPVKTKDVIPPEAVLEFDPDVNGEPLLDSDIRVVFTEEIRVVTDKSTDKRETLHELEGEELLAAIRANFIFYDEDAALDNILPDTQYTNENVICELDEQGRTVITFKGGDPLEDRALPLLSGNHYKLELSRDIYDTSNNRIEENKRELPFHTVFSRIIQSGIDDTPTFANKAWDLVPQSTEVSDNIMFDLAIWSNSNVDFNLYCKDYKEGASPEWKVFGKDGELIPVPAVGEPPLSADKLLEFHVDENQATTLYREVDTKLNPDNNTETRYQFEKLNEFKAQRSYAIKITKLNGRPANEANRDVYLYSVPVAGPLSDMRSLAADPAGLWDQMVGDETGGKIMTVGTPTSHEMFIALRDTAVPNFVDPYPKFAVGDSVMIPTVQVDRKSTLYYVVAPMVEQPAGSGTWEPSIQPQPDITDWPTEGNLMEPDGVTTKYPYLTVPTAQSIVDGASVYSGIDGAVMGKYAGADGSGIETNILQQFEIKGLKPKTPYNAFFVLKSASGQLSRVYYYKLETGEVVTPNLKLQNDIASSGLNKITVEVDQNSNIWWKLFPSHKIPQDIRDAQTGGLLIPYPEKGAGQSDEFLLTGDGLLSSIGRMIQGMDGTSDVVKAEGTLTINRQMGTPETEPIRGAVELDELEEGQSYTMVAMAQNVLGGQYRLYRLDNIIPRDMTPPQIEVVTGAIPQADGKGKWKGTVTITFSEPMYYKDRDDSKKVFPMKKENWETGPENERMSQGGEGTTKVNKVSANAEGACYAVTYTFSGWQVGSAISFPLPLADANATQAGIFKVELVPNQFTGASGELTKPGFVASLGSQSVRMWVL